MKSTRLITARLPDELVQRLDRTAAQENRSRTGQLRHALQRWLAVADSEKSAPPQEADRARRAAR